MKTKKKTILLSIGLVSIFLSLFFAIFSTYSTFNEKSISFESSYKENKVTLKGSFFEKKNAKYACLICPGYSCDRAKWKVMANVFLANNISVMTFDYSGQGESYGKIGFDNAKTDEIPKEIDDALTYLHTLSNIDYENIILMGHSMGGRSILRLMYDYNIEESDTKVTKKNIKNIILFSPEINYKHNAQASLFASTDDENEYPWKDYSEEAIKGVDVYLFGSTADDVVSDYDILRISERLTGKKAVESGTIEFVETNKYGSKITVGVTSLILHSYQMYSYRFATYVSSSISDITKVDSAYPSIFVSFVYFGWIFAIVGLFLTIIALCISKEEVKNDYDDIPVIQDSKKFVLQKLLLWIPGLIIGFLICCLCIVLPFGSPVMNIPYMCCIAGYGIVLLFFYKKNKIKGIEGRLPKISLKIQINKKELIKTVLYSLFLIIFAWFILKTSMYNLIPFNIRIFYLIFSTALMSIGYYISSIENDMLKKSKANKKMILLYNVIEYVALFLFVLFYLIIKSYSGFIGQMQNMILMYTFTLPLGNYLSKSFNNRLYGSILSSFLFQAIMITSAAIIAIF